MKYLLPTLLLIFVTGCSTVTINPKGQEKLDSEPTWQKRYSFFLYGVVGEREVDVKEVCGAKPIKQIQTQDTFMDSFLALVTLGIYTPSSVRVWCGDEGSKT